MDKNLVLAVVLSVGVYAVWIGFVEKRYAPPPAPAERLAAPSGNSEGVPGPAFSPESEASVRASKPLPEQFLRIPEAELTVSPVGAGISSYRFKGPLGWIELVTTPVPGFFATWPDLQFKPAPADAADSLAFEAVGPGGVRIRKEYRFGQAGEMHRLRVSLTNPTGKAMGVRPWKVSLGPGIGTVDSEKAENVKLQRASALVPPPQGRTQPVRLQLKPGEYSEDWKWVAVDNRYFIAAAFAPPAEFSGCSVELVGPDKAPALAVAAKAETLGPGATAVHDIPFYLGPKGYARLERLNLGLERAVDFGWFDWLGRRILRVLQWLHRWTGNYGWSIILLTMMLQVLLAPLTYKSLKAAAVMKRLQPEIQRLQQKYKGDAQRLNVEMMELYKAKGANPMGGCLPMLAQIPIFVALFNALRNCWDLHGSPWIFWIHDLSARDPFYILPLVMGGVMFLQNKMNAQQAADPTQAQMMTYMPVIFTFMFLKFPAGLVLYWLTNSVLSSLQQLALRKQLS